jgi:hypothetical protein
VGRASIDVRKLVAGPHVFICDECVELSMAIVREDSVSFYLRTPDEYRRLAADNVRAAEPPAFPATRPCLRWAERGFALQRNPKKEAGSLIDMMPPL